MRQRHHREPRPIAFGCDREQVRDREQVLEWTEQKKGFGHPVYENVDAQTPLRSWIATLDRLDRC